MNNSPLEGPHNHHRYEFNNRRQSPLYMLFYLRTIHNLGRTSSYASRYFWKLFHTTSVYAKSSMWIFSFSLITIDFYNCSHADKYDKHTERVEPMNVELSSIMFDNHMPKWLVRQAAFSSSYISDTNGGCITTCCYQRINDDESLNKVEDWYYFVMDGLISSLRIHNHMTLSFSGSSFQHNTSIPIYILRHSDDHFTVWIGKHPSISYMAWGATDNSGGTSEAASIVRTSRKQSRRHRKKTRY